MGPVRDTQESQRRPGVESLELVIRSLAAQRGDPAEPHHELAQVIDASVACPERLGWK